jgi:hypothetical protein
MAGPGLSEVDQGLSRWNWWKKAAESARRGQQANTRLATRKRKAEAMVPYLSFRGVGVGARDPRLLTSFLPTRPFIDARPQTRSTPEHDGRPGHALSRRVL